MEEPRSEKHEKKRKKKSESNSDEELYVSMIDVQGLRNQNRELQVKLEEMQRQLALCMEQLNKYKQYENIENNLSEIENDNVIEMNSMEAAAVGPIQREDSVEDNDGQWHTITGRNNEYLKEFPALESRGHQQLPPQKQQQQQRIQQNQYKQQQQSQQQNGGIQSSQQTLNKKGKASPPIIKVHNIEIKELTGKIKNLLKNDLFSIKIINKNTINLSLNSTEDHQLVKQFLKEQKVAFFTYTPSELKPYSVLVKGLSSSYEIEDLESHIKGLNANVTVNKIVKFNGDRWLVQLSHDSDLAAVLSMKYILHCKVAVERFKQGGIVQCRNCQRFGHIATNCSMEYRCVKCGLVHGPGNCTIPNKESNTEIFVRKNPVTGVVEKRVGFPVKCINCNKEGHVASAKTCPKRLEIKKKLDERRANKARLNYTQSRPTTQYRTANGSYAGVANNNGMNVNYQRNGGNDIMATANEAFTAFDRNCTRLLGGDVLSCLSKIKAFAGPFSRIQNDEEKTKAIFGLLLSIGLNE